MNRAFAQAPKQFPDLKAVRAAPDTYARNAVLRNYKRHEQTPYRLTEISQQIAAINKDLVNPRRQLKALERQLGAAKAAQKDAIASQAYSAIQGIRTNVDALTKQQDELSEEASTLALALPNLTSQGTPQGDQPRLLRYLNHNPDSSQLKAGTDHATIGQELGILDFASATTASGWGFYYFLGDAVLLEQALIRYATLVARKHGWQMVAPPSVVYSHIINACGFQPRDENDEQQIWQIEQAEKDIGKVRRGLAATAEIPLAALYADKAIPIEKLPLKLVGSSRCYRAEAGARGVDTKGLYRVHEFTKVEMFAWSDAAQGEEVSQIADTTYSEQLFNEMVEIQCEILTGLELPCRVLEMPSSDLGASAYRKIDIEAFFPSRTSRDEGWGEVTSVSICTDYQSRRLNTRILDKDKSKQRFPHTINGTAMAVPRIMACILEHGWDENARCIKVPSVLWQYMDGLEVINR